ncbi:MAG: FtsW/RodA/SpoVE family cell cycle protein, partial [Candidatus Hydrothermae bacterium]|nr:FtsW/RodA/SpoVE family cell cycle protein [Candidatus Hydrothermae bacterium]
VYLAWYLSDRRPHLYPGFAPWLPPLLWSGVLTLLIILQPNFSTAGLYLLLTAAFLWVGGMPFRAFLAVGVATMAFVGLAYRFSPHVHTRMDLFLHGDLHEQVRWALATLKHGGLLGVGPGRGVLKHNVPQAQNDFMFASVGEDLGLVGAVLVIVLFLLLWALGYRLLQEERWRFEWYLVYGAVVLLISQAFLHIAVNLGVFPITGQVLPFLSQGGSNLLVSAWAAGILWNASRLPW